MEKKVMLFKDSQKGIGKKSEKPFHRVTLHDEKTLDNIDFFLQPGSMVDPTGLKLKDKVEATLKMDMVFGKPQIVLDALVKV